eukprot:CAMPEP_0114316754 /NCGR_PEP_ID=MMETSP0059-20121206/23437_1 /TAXON_ID=36894 /ORGANISM="Pyramimonas parkeae, Strain CCMP726" /LENGTH=98 /DNA_ID=CAMNT_0001442837 /DNA_START=402 /DNA_END=698 /DNA_ORIENTATION=-
MAGTATEQVVGLGLPAFVIPGQGPQFTPEFARLQGLLLGKSVIFCSRPVDVGSMVPQVLHDQKRLETIRENGANRMGSPGSSKRIATEIMSRLVLKSE